MRSPLLLISAVIGSTLGVAAWTDAARGEVVEGSRNLVKNGGFEQRKEGTPNKNIEPLTPESDMLVGWEIIDPETWASDQKVDVGKRPQIVEWIGPQRWSAAEGEHCLDLDGGIRQVVPTIAGQRYVLRFEMAGNPESGPRFQHLKVMINQREYKFDFDSTAKTKRDLGWATKEIAFVAARDRTSLAFINALPNAHSAGVALDNVALREAGDAPVDDNAAARLLELYRRMRRFEQEAEELRRAGRDAEAEAHAKRAESYRKQFEELLARCAH